MTNHYQTNLEPPGPYFDSTFVLAAHEAELLARGPEDFADDVPLVTWEDWLAQKEPESIPNVVEKREEIKWRTH